MRRPDPWLWLFRVVLLLVLLIFIVRGVLADHVLGYVLRAPDGSRIELTLDDCRDPFILHHVPIQARRSTHQALGASTPTCWYPDPPSAQIVLVTRKGMFSVPITFLARELKV